MKGTLIGIDLGTTALKVAAFRARSGKLLEGVSKRLRIEVGADGRREQNPASVARALRSALREIATRTVDLGQVRGIGLAAQGGSMIIADRDTGKALTPMTLWNDLRALPEYRKLSESRPPEFWRAFSFRDDPGIGLARLQWLRGKSPGLLRPENLYAGAGEWLYFQLTGVWRQDAGNAVQIGCYDVQHDVLDERAAALGGVQLSFFAPLRRGHQTSPLSGAASKWLGLPEGTPVAGPYMDHEAGFLSTAQVSKKPLQCSLGTAWVGSFRLPKNSRAGSPFQLVIPSPVGPGRLIVQPLLTGNVTWDWALSQFVSPNHKKALANQADIFSESLLPAEGLVALPWLNWPNPLNPESTGACSFLGVGPSTTNADLLRAVANGMCHELRRVFGAVKTRGTIDSLVLSGGASKGSHFRDLIAALFAPLPVFHVVDEDWMGTRGALHTFGVQTSCARAERLQCSDRIDEERLLLGHTLYMKAFEALYSTVREGEACSFGRTQGRGS